jgi:outer membrane protein OmpA-like peptidoglycan-associated protein
MAFNKLRTAAVLAAMAVPCGFTVAAAADAQGTSAFQFLQLGVGARPAAMGEVFAGVAHDANAVYWNPAGLAGMQRDELSMTHALWLEDITYSNAVYARHALGGTIGAAFNILNTGSIQKADNTGLRLAENYSMSDMLGLVSYAREWGDLALGANLKYISSRIEEESASSYAADVGALYGGLRLWGRPLTAGLAVQNLGAKVKYVSEENPLPVITRAGVALQVFKNLLVASDLVYTEKNASLRGGAEYTRRLGALVLAARAGYKSDTVKELGALSGLTAGMGVKLGDYQVDYAWNSFTDLGVTHRISLAMRFGGPDDDSDGVDNYLDKCPGTPRGAAVDAAGCVLDTDADKVPDYLDHCPATSTMAVVDAAGCPLDEDSDTVPDYLDKCPGTPHGAAVDAAGCVLDTDADKVPDYLDLCPATSTMAVVDSSGCPVDADADKVPDYLDLCPATSTMAVVDSSGCPVDADADKVPDYLDKCPNTPAGALVDSAGCPAATAVEAKAMDRLLQIAMPGSVTPEIVDAVRDAAADPACPWEQVNRLCMKLAMEFDSDKAELKGDFAEQLKGIAAFMAANSWAQIELQGHTDDHGDEAYNLKLSEDRAQAVLKHFVSADGLATERLSSKGLGKTQPFTSNATEEGRQANRRVIAILSMEKAP